MGRAEPVLEYVDKAWNEVPSIRGLRTHLRPVSPLCAQEVLFLPVGPWRAPLEMGPCRDMSPSCHDV